MLDAEYAATHRGETSWTDDHPLDDVDDIIHSLINRIEGSLVGEGGYTGYENAKYWAAGGPKKLAMAEICEHPVCRALVILATRKADLFSEHSSLLLATLIPSQTVEHKIIAGGGKSRTVSVPAGNWDSLALIDLWQQASSSLTMRSQLLKLLEIELNLLQVWESCGRTLSVNDLVQQVA